MWGRTLGTQRRTSPSLSVSRRPCVYGKALLSGQDGAVEEALWTALRTLEESAALRRRLAGDARIRKQNHLATSYEHRAKQMEDRAGVIREALLHRDLPKDLKGYGSSKPAKVLSRRTRVSKKS